MIIREDSVIIGMDYQNSTYSEETDIDDVKTCNDKTNYIRTLRSDRKFIYRDTCMQTDILRHRYLLTTESMRRITKALVNNRSNIIVGSCKQTMLLYFQR